MESKGDSKIAVAAAGAGGYPGRGMSRATQCGAIVALGIACFACERHDVDVEAPPSGRPLSRMESAEIQRIADGAFRDVRAAIERSERSERSEHLPSNGLPPRLTLIVRWGKDVIPETGETGAAGYPGNIGWTVDPDRDVLTTIRTQLRPTLVHELHHLARASRVQTRTLVERVVSEGLATVFERDVAKVPVPWGEPPPDPMAWTREILAQPPTADLDRWMFRHPDGRRWIGYRVGTFLVDRAIRASGKSAADLVFVPAEEIVRLADVQAPKSDR
jgi:hypothetical protein